MNSLIGLENCIVIVSGSLISKMHFVTLYLSSWWCNNNILYFTLRCSRVNQNGFPSFILVSCKCDIGKLFSKNKIFVQLFTDWGNFQNYQYRQECGDPNGSVEPYHIGRTRRRRSGHAIFVSFTTTTVPLKPRQTALRFLNIKFLSGEHLQKMKEVRQVLIVKQTCLSAVLLRVSWISN